MKKLLFCLALLLSAFLALSPVTDAEGPYLESQRRNDHNGMHDIAQKLSEIKPKKTKETWKTLLGDPEKFNGFEVELLDANRIKITFCTQKCYYSCIRPDHVTHISWNLLFT